MPLVQVWPRTDLLPNYGPGTSKRFRKPVTTDNTVISYCEKRNFGHSSDLAEAKIYLFAVLVSFDMPSTNHFFFGVFAHKSEWQWLWWGFWGVCFRTLRAVVSRFWQRFRRLTPVKIGLVILTNLRMLRKVSVRNWKFLEGKSQELAKLRSIFTISPERSSSSYWSCVTFVSHTVTRSLFSMKCRSIESDLTSSG